MRLDHCAYRVADRRKTAQFFIDAFGYKIQAEFTIDFGNGQTAECIALEPSEKTKSCDWTVLHESTMYHMAPEIFVSDGSPGSIVDQWVKARGGIGGIHHIDYQVDSVEEKMKEWKEKGYSEFTSEYPMKCPGLTQIFTKPSVLTGVIFEFIEREEHGFCAANVRQLMESTSGL